MQTIHDQETTIMNLSHLREPLKCAARWEIVLIP